MRWHLSLSASIMSLLIATLGEEICQMRKNIIHLPDIFGHSVRESDTLFCLLDSLPEDHEFTIDMSEVSFLRPFDTLNLLLAIRLIFSKTTHPITLANIPDSVHKYLDRIDFFKMGNRWVVPDKKITEKWYRKKASDNLLELTKITTYEEKVKIISRVKRIFSHWLSPDKVSFLEKIISELCDNVQEHSGDPNVVVLMQKYDHRDHTNIVVAIGDLGQGIRGSLSKIHPSIGTDPIDFLNAALNGATSRPSGRGGLGLGQVEQITEKNAGYFWIRSENAAIFSHGRDFRERVDTLPFLPGTQIVAELNFR